MTSISLGRGMGSLLKKCDCPKPARCRHEYTIRYRDSGGNQRERGGFATQQDAKDELTKIYLAKKDQTRSSSIDVLARMTYEEYVADWIARQSRGWAQNSEKRVNSDMGAHILPRLSSRKVGTFASVVLDDFILSMEQDKVGSSAQVHAFDTLRKSLIPLIRKGVLPRDLFDDVVPPQHIAQKIEIPTLAEIKNIRENANDRLKVIIDLMHGCGNRNGEAFAASLNKIVADDVYRISDQVTRYREVSRLKHRNVGEFRETPLPSQVKETLHWYDDKHGNEDGYMLVEWDPKNGRMRFPHYGTIRRDWLCALKDVDLEGKYTMYSLRHFFASTCLSNGIPITDVAEWMGHKSIEVTFKTYRHLMPSSVGNAAKRLSLALAV
ncbi:tyrosine-type recombinase/integrase [Streptomyces decoyicus]|uniref:tyrosine-type recombinase/integrase n=1 Tax=Streptomyces decoyicus TaxID=249567 RepID=UPI003868039F